TLDLGLSIETQSLARFDRPLSVTVREARLLREAPWVRTLGKLPMEVATEGWKFPTPMLDRPIKPAVIDECELADPCPRVLPEADAEKGSKRVRALPTGDTVMLKDRLLYLLQPPLENLFRGKQVQVPSQPFPYQLEGIAFLMPRHAALLADEMG